MGQRPHPLTKSTGGFGNLTSSEKEKLKIAITEDQEALRRIPEPPDSYQEMKRVIYKMSDEEQRLALVRFYKSHEDDRVEIQKYMSFLSSIRYHNIKNSRFFNKKPYKGEGLNPLEKIEVGDGKSVWMLLVDFNIDEKRNLKKIYIPLESLTEAPEWGPKYSFFNEGKHPEQISKVDERIKPEDFEMLRSKAKTGDPLDQSIARFEERKATLENVKDMVEKEEKELNTQAALIKTLKYV